MSASGSNGPGLGTVFVVSAITSALVSAGVVLAMVEGFRFVPDEEVPELTGLTIDAARGMLDARGLRLVERGERHDPEIDEGLIASQEPGARSVVRSGSEVTVFVSLGRDRIEVPDLTGLGAPAATARLANLGLRATTREGGEGEPGTVAATTPSAGTPVDRDAEIALTIVPEADPTIAVPDLTGISSRTARETIVQAGLVVGRVSTGFDADRSPYVVLRQTPPPGTQVDPGTEIELVVNED
ncbi:MAG: PASTA domain-containing protein [Myxococcota bacterium]|nr:PASTA domain-containing protein [Myxococcota bacterium]